MPFTQNLVWLQLSEDKCPHFITFQVYKVVVQWTNDKEIIIYRKYSFFFDFVVSEMLSYKDNL